MAKYGDEEIEKVRESIAKRIAESERKEMKKHDTERVSATGNADKEQEDQGTAAGSSYGFKRGSRRSNRDR